MRFGRQVVGHVRLVGAWPGTGRLDQAVPLQGGQMRPHGVIGAYVVAFWLWGIIINLLLGPGFYDIALRDFGLSLGALALARLSQEFDRGSGGWGLLARTSTTR